MYDFTSLGEERLQLETDAVQELHGHECEDDAVVELGRRWVIQTGQEIAFIPVGEGGPIKVRPRQTR